MDFDFGAFGPDDLDRIAKETRGTMRRLEEATASLTAVRGEGEAAEGLVRAVVDNTGALVTTSLSPRAMRLPSETLAEAFTAAVRAAQDDARRKTQALLAEAIGIDSLSVSTFNSDRIRERFQRIEESFNGRVDAHTPGRRRSTG